jgi:hypothetical protein
MILKLLFRIPSPSKEERLQKVSKLRSSITGGMYFDTSPTQAGEPLLLPDESCLAEDEKAAFHVHCEREGFHLFGWGDIDFGYIDGKIYLTTYRVAST